MKNDLRMYGQEFNPNVIKDVTELNKEIEKEVDQEKLMNLRLKRLYRGMELNTNLQQRSFRTFYPY